MKGILEIEYKSRGVIDIINCIYDIDVVVSYDKILVEDKIVSICVDLEIKNIVFNWQFDYLIINYSMDKFYQDIKDLIKDVLLNTYKIF